MVEAMFERSPGYFKQFQKQFNFFVTDEKLNLTDLNNFAVCSHYNSDFFVSYRRRLTNTTFTF